MKKIIAVILMCLIFSGTAPVSVVESDAKVGGAHGDYEFTSLPGFEQFETSELSELYMVGFSNRNVTFSDELVPDGVDKALKLPVSGVGAKIISTARHLHVKDQYFYDGLQNVGGKTLFGDIKFSDYDGIAFWVGNYTDSITVILRNSPCGGPYGYEGTDEHKEIYNQEGIGLYFRSSNITPDENGYVFLSHDAFHTGYTWWEQGTYKEEVDRLNAIDIVFNNEKLNVGANIYIGDFKVYKESKNSERTLDDLIPLLEQTDTEGKYSAELAEAKEVWKNGTDAQKKEKIRELTLLLKPVLLKELYVNTYNSMRDRITEIGYSPTSVTGFYDGMYVRDSSIQSTLHTLQGETRYSRAILKYILGAYQELGAAMPNHVISEIRETAYGNNDGGAPGQYAAIIKLGGDSTAMQTISSNETVVSVGVWLSRKDEATGMVYAELKRDGKTVGTDCIKASELSKTKGYVVFDFGFPITPVKKGDYTLTITAPDSPSESVIWYGRRSYRGLLTTVDGEVINSEASYEAFKTAITFESTDIQPDTILVLAHAWIAYANKAPDTPEDNAFIEESWPIIKKYVSAFIGDSYINPDLKLIKTDYLEHTRDYRKWKCYDLITNSYASQVFYEFSQFAADLGATEEAAEWNRLSLVIKEGINENLTTEIDGKRIYAEMIAIDEGNKYYQGMSWVNLGPIAAGWYGLDVEMMKRTLEVYANYASVNYGDIRMLDACYNMFTGDYADHVIGKGYSWELMFSAAVGNAERLDEMVEFMLMNSPANNMYPESWWYPDKFSDVGNQEHSSWLSFGMATVFPELIEAVDELRYDVDRDGDVTVADALAVLRRVAFPKNYYSSEKEEADFDRDGSATVADALSVLRRAAGLQ